MSLSRRKAIGVLRSRISERKRLVGQNTLTKDSDLQ